jgi:DNA mismatch repair protein MutL
MARQREWWFNNPSTKKAIFAPDLNDFIPLMTDVIQLLPENIANQIAAGEVVQRPASVVKELLENAIDAGATEIKLVIRDAGKTLIQVIDNGCGMSENDARMSFERHATSKIREAKDLFAIRTMGFRGEALASIAAVAQVEMRTRRIVDELGLRLVIENTLLKAQEPVQTPVGTSITVKNLFFSVPARRNFLKSDPVEMRHVLDEFQRAAISYPDIFFSFFNNDQEVLHLPPGNLRQRVVKIFGDAVNKKLVPVQEETDALRITGFISKPDHYKKTRGEQYFFVNNRFIKSSYLHHAVVSAYEDLLPSDSFPLYVLFMDIDPGRIDINVHPTKQEIKFDDEKLIYNILKVSVRHALGSHNITPMLDFETEPAFEQRPTPMPRQEPEPQASVGAYQLKKSNTPREDSNLRNWQRLYEGLEMFDRNTAADTSIPKQEEEGFATLPSGSSSPTLDEGGGVFNKGDKDLFQLHGQYVVSQIRSGFLLIDQQYASERILYERYLEALSNRPLATQRALFPKTITLPAADAELLLNVLDEVNCLGFEIAEFGRNTFIIHGTPAELGSGADEQAVIEKLLAQYKDNLDLSPGIHENLARAMARSAAPKRGQTLSQTEMRDLIDQLFACSIPFKSPSGRNCFITFDLDELQKRFEA